MLPQQQTVFGVEDANVEFVPLHSDQASDPAWGQAVVGGFDFDTTVQMHHPLAVLVVAKRFQGQWKQGRFFFGNMTATCRLVVPCMRVSAQLVSQWSR